MNRKHIVVFSGGSAANNLVDVFGKLASEKVCSLSYIIPISDNGGSTSELIRVFGGPGIGDVRSRLVRLIPSTTPESAALKALFNHRLPSTSSTDARNEWLDIVESRHPLWQSITSPKRELIRSFLNTINLEIVKRARPSSVFNFQSASVGNLFLTGARLFTGSLESAIYLLGAITGVSSEVEVVPVINSGFSHHISAGLRDGTVITGQNAISHPSSTSTSGLPYASKAPTPIPTGTATPVSHEPSFTTSSSLLAPSSHAPSHIHPSHIPVSPTSHDQDHDHDSDKIEDANLPGSHPNLRISSITFSKSTHLNPLLSSPISRIWYINPYGQEIIPPPSPNPKVIETLSKASCIIYSIGSLYTSIIPCLVLRGVGECIARGGVKYKILILNGSLDRETKGDGWEYGAKEFVEAVVKACIPVFSTHSSVPQLSEFRKYVTHIIHLVGEGTPRVEREELAALGIECVRIYGRRNPDVDGEGMIYDNAALGGALEAIIGKGDSRSGEKSRRNTLGYSGPVV